MSMLSDWDLPPAARRFLAAAIGAVVLTLGTLQVWLIAASDAGSRERAEVAEQYRQRLEEVLSEMRADLDAIRSELERQR